MKTASSILSRVIDLKVPNILYIRSYMQFYCMQMSLLTIWFSVTIIEIQLIKILSYVFYSYFLSTVVFSDWPLLLISKQSRHKIINKEEYWYLNKVDTKLLIKRNIFQRDWRAPCNQSKQWRIECIVRVQFPDVYHGLGSLVCAHISLATCETNCIL